MYICIFFFNTVCFTSSSEILPGVIVGTIIVFFSPLPEKFSLYCFGYPFFKYTTANKVFPLKHSVSMLRDLLLRKFCPYPVVSENV